jgi:signal transduction histidine kinase
VLVNLIGNLLKFTHDGGISMSVRLGGVEGRSTALHFSVTDTGIAIPAEKRKLIFQPFSQADTSTTRKYGGTGFGLTISSRLVEMMGGHDVARQRGGPRQYVPFHGTLPKALRQRNCPDA